MNGPRQVRTCRYCPEVVTSTNPDVDYCRGCYYSGTWHREQFRVLLNELYAADLQDVDVWHTGGGCFAICVPLETGPEPTQYLLVTADQDGQLPDADTPETLWWIGHYTDDPEGELGNQGECIVADGVARADLVDAVVRAAAGEAV